jgi:hypothetical protein
VGDGRFVEGVAVGEGGDDSASEWETLLR